ncbi:MAG: thrombospondin type 3 repeat-containing protein [Myxococcales bacterium]|nr:thrombospondin type 3 repeat-containing protein [Myxococcales bacterium]
MSLRIALSALCLTLLAAPAFGQINPGFESGNLSGWSAVGSASVVTGHVGYSGTRYAAPQGSYFARVTAGCPWAPHFLSQSFTLAAGQSISGYAAFDARDYIPFADSARVKITAASVNTTAWYNDVYTVGTYGDGPWQQWTFTAPTAGTYKLIYQVQNYGDCALSSIGLFDSACSDADGDGVCDDADNCPNTANANQSNIDGDNHGDVCDNCPGTANNDQLNSDSDSLGDVCDNCATVTNQDQLNSDKDAFGDVCDICPFDFYNDADGDSVCGDVDFCPNTASSDTAAGVPSNELGTNRWADTDGDGIFDTTLPSTNGKGKGKATGPQLSFTIAQTEGCNCAQIIEVLELGNGHTKFGCSISAMQDWLAYLAIH